jgi:hypothetical protein
MTLAKGFREPSTITPHVHSNKTSRIVSASINIYIFTSLHLSIAGKREILMSPRSETINTRRLLSSALNFSTSILH